MFVLTFIYIANAAVKALENARNYLAVVKSKEMSSSMKKNISKLNDETDEDAEEDDPHNNDS